MTTHGSTATNTPAPSPTGRVANIAAAAGLIAAWIAIAAVTWPGSLYPATPPHPSAPTDLSLTTSTPTAPLHFGPITFFNNACASCHGDYGFLFGERLTTSYDDESLRRIVAEMVRGQAQTRLEPRELDALTAYTRSLIDGAPFLAWTVQEANTLRGEVTPGSTVELIAPEATTPATVTGHTWTAPLPPGLSPLTLRARRGETATLLDLVTSAFSHTAPIDPPPNAD